MSRLTQHWHRFEVTGSGQFPFNMLRYDQSFPIYSDDAHIMANPSDDVQVVALGHWGPSTWEPSNDRWRSFHWAVTHHEVMR
ncbi:MAG: hypothetical protein HQ492_03995 [Woeseiaceae bacterium]|nr:hypothetical protein [Woeseiaceae bacterium]